MQVINTPFAPAAIGTYSQAVRVGNLVFLSGQIPLNPETMAVVECSFDVQIEQVFRNIGAICEASGGTLANLVKLTVYLTDLKQFTKVNELMARLFKEPYPARAVIEISALPRGVEVEIDGIMEVPDCAR